MTAIILISKNTHNLLICSLTHWVNESDQYYDALGSGVPANKLNTEKFLLQVEKHLTKADIVPIDATTLSYEQFLEIQR